MPEPRLVITDLSVVYRQKDRAVHALSGVSLNLPERRILGIVGESGSGKSTLALGAMGAAEAAEISGQVRFDGQDLLALPEEGRRKLWGNRLAMVFQDPGSTLNPVLRIGEQVTEVLRRHRGSSQTEATARLREIFKAVQFADPDAIARRYPHELSGGQKQRVSIAIAVACNPDVLFLDEPTTGLDVTTEARILELIVSLRDRFGTAIVLISHNLGVIAQVCDEVAVMYAGEVIEHGDVREVLSRPRHPYTTALLDCLPRIDPPSGSARFLPAMAGSLPDLAERPVHCQFAPRCPIVQPPCWAGHPPLQETDPGHHARCLYWQDGHRAREPAEPVHATPPATDAASQPVVQAVDLVHEYRTEARTLKALFGRSRMRAVNHVGLKVNRGETLALVGESGSGKTTIARILVGLLSPSAGSIQIAGSSVPKRPASWPPRTRQRIQMVFQNPDMTLNPRRTVFDTIARPLERFGTADRATRAAHVTRLLDAVRLDRRHLAAFPSQLSGGERQRVAIARAIACTPDIVVCDEPTSALDVSVQAAVLNLLVALQRERHVSYLFISHDLAVVRHIADRVVVLYHGAILETGSTADIFTPPFHPYTELLLAAVPTVGGDKRTPIRVDGPVSNLAAPTSGCPFHLQCPRKLGAICEQETPPLRSDGHGHAMSCHIAPTDLIRMQTKPVTKDPAVARDIGG